MKLVFNKSHLYPAKFRIWHYIVNDIANPLVSDAEVLFDMYRLSVDGFLNNKQAKMIENFFILYRGFP